MGNFLSISPLGILTPNNKEACDSNLCLDVMSKSDGIYHSLGKCLLYSGANNVTSTFSVSHLGKKCSVSHLGKKLTYSGRMLSGK